ncbi:GPGG-motif small membrane protein [Demequina sp. NBRC 110054]|nr:GPGG-motif small membrane protein [Demequina sp. NBRC 110054]
MWDAILWIAAVIIGIIGVVRILQKDILWGIVLIVVALLIGPGGVSLLT